MNQDEQSADERKAKNRDTWALIKTYPLMGVGVNPDESRYVDRFPMASGQVHSEILMAGKQMGLIGMGLHVGFLAVMIMGGWWVQQNAKDWPAVSNLGWTFQMQGVAIAVGGSFCPLAWNPVTMMIAGAASALIMQLKAEQEARMMRLAGL